MQACTIVGMILLELHGRPRRYPAAGRASSTNVRLPAEVVTLIATVFAVVPPAIATIPAVPASPAIPITIDPPAVVVVRRHPVRTRVGWTQTVSVTPGPSSSVPIPEAFDPLVVWPRPRRDTICARRR